MQSCHEDGDVSLRRRHVVSTVTACTAFDFWELEEAVRF